MTKREEATGKLSALCPNCSAPREADAAFCEVCGVDYATGEAPAAPAPVPAAPVPGHEASAWALVVEIDADFFAKNKPEGAELELPTGGAAQEAPLRGDEALIGRASASAGLHPDIDLSSDPGVSRRHAVLSRRGDRWVVVDQGSTNGTSVDGKPLPAGEEREVKDGSVIHLGAWTKLTLKRATS